MIVTVPPILPASQKALKVLGSRQVELATDAILPVLDVSEVLVLVACVGVNPVDGKSIDLSPTPGATCGTDFSGIVVALGSHVSTEQWHIGDRVFGCIFGNNPLRPDNGAFAEYAACPAQLLLHIPDLMDMTTAASLGTAIATVGLSLFEFLQIPMPDVEGPLQRSTVVEKSKPEYVMVYGGGTASGCMAIQVLSLLGYAPITACSAASAPRALALGAVATFDYHSSSCGPAILEYTAGTVRLALDCITDVSSMEICYHAIGPEGGRYIALEPFPLRGHTRRSVTPDWVSTHTQFGHRIAWAPPFDIDERPEHRARAVTWYSLAQRLLDDGLIKPHPLEVQQGGFTVLPEAVSRVRKGQIRARKLVCPI